MAEEIKAEIREKEGLTCSIGIASGRVIAKIAAGSAKPDGLTVVPPESAAAFLSPLPVEKIPGIGAKTATILHGMGIITIGDLAGTDIQRLIGRFGRSAVGLQRLARGGDESGLREFQETRSLSREVTFEEDTDVPGGPPGNSRRPLPGPLCSHQRREDGISDSHGEDTVP